ncbi:MAG TPA: carboxypeptidase-like regulatory domain-containing protein [Candidatus Polarisedimenticolaceae bacterium]|nr:carboxypeptidase-like regulatory domain-containing protein [Candidatus Polarisedimenticolaceae bacterium]
MLALALGAGCAAVGEPGKPDTVLDAQGQPLAGARVCYAEGPLEVLCVESDAAGHYELPAEDRVSSIRASKSGYLTQTIPSSERVRPIVMRAAAALWVRLKNAATGEPIPRGELDLAFASGKKNGPFPVNRNGVRIGSLPAENVALTARAEGFAAAAPRTLQLAAGEETTVELELQPQPPLSR